MREIEEYNKHLDRLVRERGWAVQFVGAGDGHPSFAYTVGLRRQYRHHEFVLVGVPPGAASTLNELGARVRDGQVFRPGDQPDEVLPGYRTELVAVTMRHSFEELLMAWRMSEEPVTALQLVWPDEADHLPWEEGYSLPLSAQPLWGPRGKRPHTVYRLD
ncbi:MAG TPA: DUF4262 domain-containing protein [Frankiaceae bacterium]|nr:DUF4262 domain-containing protein [Frankiaceae bacterium]